MTIKIEIKRSSGSSDKPRVQTFTVETENTATVAQLLERINEEQTPEDPIGWESSCKQRKCGACAMLINERPRLACDARVKEYPKGVIRLAPLRKFPVVRDLIVDRTSLYSDLGKLGSWLESDAVPDSSGDAYDASRCIRCGCCLEVCPNFYAGGEFFGASALVSSARLISEAGTDDTKRVTDAYKEHFYRGCGKSLACMNVCPAGIDTERLLVKSNAVAVWNRKKRGAGK